MTGSKINADSITYHKADFRDINTLVDYRIIFAEELSGPKPLEMINALKEQMTDYFTRATAENNCISFIAECDGEIAGIGSVVIREQPGHFRNISGKWGYIMNMYTVKKFRRRGICREILYLLVEEAKKSGAAAFELHATEEGEFVYKQSGFIIHKEPTYRKFINWPVNLKKSI